MNTRTSEPPTISYRSDSESGEKKSVPIQVAKTADRLLSGVTWVVLGVVLIVWAVVGFSIFAIGRRKMGVGKA